MSVFFVIKINTREIYKYILFFFQEAMCVSFDTHMHYQHVGSLHVFYAIYYICLELLTPTDSESSPRGWRRQWKRALNSETERGQRSDRQEDRQEIKRQQRRDGWDGLTGARSPCGLLMRRKKGAGRGELVSTVTWACQISCVSSHSPATPATHSIAH